MSEHFVSLCRLYLPTPRGICNSLGEDTAIYTCWLMTNERYLALWFRAGLGFRVWREHNTLKLGSVSVSSWSAHWARPALFAAPKTIIIIINKKNTGHHKWVELALTGCAVAVSCCANKMHWWSISASLGKSGHMHSHPNLAFSGYEIRYVFKHAVVCCFPLSFKTNQHACSVADHCFLYCQSLLNTTSL